MRVAKLKNKWKEKNLIDKFYQNEILCSFFIFADMRYFIHMAYNGTRYCGWQIQPNALSVQGELNDALSRILGENIETVGAGRTDSGVHASCFFAHFDTEKTLNLQDVVYKLNRILSRDIVIYNVFPVADDLHARFSALSRTYTYTITKVKNPFAIETELYIPQKINVDEMNAACALLIGTHDFTSFSKFHTDVKNNICTITKAQWEENDRQIIFTITANRFLRNMVRSIVGTLLDVGQKKITVEQFADIVESKNRQNAGQSISACGLSLCDIEYPANCFEK